MTPIAHISSGYLVYAGIANTVKPDNFLLLLVSIAGALVLDMDALFGGKIKDHRNTVFHAPLFWLVVFIVAFGVSYLLIPTLLIYIYAFFLGVFIHLFLDWLGGRTAGIKIFYPFTDKKYALFPIKPEKGDISVLSIKGQGPFWKFYLKNKILVVIELIIIVSPVFVYFMLK